MDERERIPRHEAIIGLSVLGVTMISLVVTVVIRIVNAAPKHGPPESVPTWVMAPDEPMQSAPGFESTSPPSDDRYAAAPEAAPFQPAAPIPTVGDGSSSVPATSMAPTQAPDFTPMPGHIQPQPVEPVRPRFVAPSAR